MLHWTLCIIFIFLNNQAFCKENSIISISCTSLKVMKLDLPYTWTLIRKIKSCPLNDESIINLCKTAFNEKINYFRKITKTNVKDFCKTRQCNVQISKGNLLYECLELSPSTTPLILKENCEFKHIKKNINCYSGMKWSKISEKICESQNLNLDQLSGLFPCNYSADNMPQLFNGVQFICCPHFDVTSFYKNQLGGKFNSIRKEMRAYLEVKKALRKHFGDRQRQIRDRFADEEKSININTSKYPKIMAELDQRFQKNFREKFMAEMTSEAVKVNELEILHENRMQKLFNERREKSRKRLEYTLQETNPESERISQALRIELNTILTETEDVIEFFERLIMEGLNQSTTNLMMIKGNFESLINISWKNVLDMLDKVDELKEIILESIEDLRIKRKKLIEKFHKIFKRKPNDNLINLQSESYIENIIALHRHNVRTPNVTLEVAAIVKDNERILVMATSIVCIALIVIVCIVFTLLLYRHSTKINVYLTSKFKKWHHNPYKSRHSNHKKHNQQLRFLQSASISSSTCSDNNNYPFISRRLLMVNNNNNNSNNLRRHEENHPQNIYGNNGCHSDDQIMISNPILQDTILHDDSLINNDKNDLTTSFNMNGLENPICRLLDEK